MQAEPKQPNEALRELRIGAALAEFAAVRGQILESGRRSHNLALSGVGGAAAILTAIAGFKLDPGSVLVAQLLVVAGLTILALAYVGISGEMLQAGDYLLELGAWVRGQLDSLQQPLNEGAPVLRFEERMAGRSRSESWSILASTLATFEMGGIITAAIGLLGWAIYSYLSDAASRGDLAILLLGFDVVLAAILLLSIRVLVGAQHRRLVGRSTDATHPAP